MERAEKSLADSLSIGQVEADQPKFAKLIADLKQKRSDGDNLELAKNTRRWRRPRFDYKRKSKNKEKPANSFWKTKNKEMLGKYSH